MADRIMRKLQLRQTYYGVLMILRQFISKDKYTENHSYRVSIYATKIAAYLGFRPERIEDVPCAALLHDIGKLEISRELLHKAGRLSKEEFNNVQEQVEKGAQILDPLGGSMRRIIPIILATTTSSTGQATATRRAKKFHSKPASSPWPTSTTRSPATALTERGWRRSKRARSSKKGPARILIRRSWTLSSARLIGESWKFPK